MSESILLKWGTIKGWNDLTEKSQEILRRYFADGTPYSCMSDAPNGIRRAVLCELIDQLDGEVRNDWSGKAMSKEESKKYITEYRK